LRADIVAQMMTATICVQQAGAMHFFLECLYKIARSEEKEAALLFDKESTPTTLTIATKDTTTIMSTFTDSDGYSTVSRCGWSITSPPKLHSLSPPPFVLTVMA
jgi:hypothetical protein